MNRPAAWRSRFAPFLPALALAASGCIYAVQPAPLPAMTPVATSLPLRVGIIGDAANKKSDMRIPTAPTDALVTALLRTGLFRDVRSAAGGAGGFDVVVELSGDQDRTMHQFFPFFLPFCDPLLIGCLPFYPVSERFTAQMQATVSGGKVYSETGEAALNCQGALGCVPASQGDPLARTSALENAAAKIAADFLKDAAFFRNMAQATASRQSAASDEAERPAPAMDPEPSAAPAPAPAAGTKPWWQQ